MNGSSFGRAHGITHVVNCTYGESKIPDFHMGKLSYYNFSVCGFSCGCSHDCSQFEYLVCVQVSHWQAFVNATNASVLGRQYKEFAFRSCNSNSYELLLFCLYAAFTEPLFNFIENAVRNGESVLVSLHLLFMKNVVVAFLLYDSARVLHERYIGFQNPNLLVTRLQLRFTVSPGRTARAPRASPA
jgi:hypothetical protein